MRDRGQDKGNGERKGGMGRSRRTLEGERGRLREDDDGWKDVKSSKEGEKGTRGRDH